jgi:spore maturation protein CgeB
LRIAFFYHSVRSDWNHGNAHFLRGMVRALKQMGHQPVCYEEQASWSVTNLVADYGMRPLVDFRRTFPFVDVRLYQMAPKAQLDRYLADELAGVDVVMVNEWPAVENPVLVEALLRLRRTCGYSLIFHDTHHRILTEPERVLRAGLDRFDSTVAYGPSIAAWYRDHGFEDVHVMHEAADVALFHPMPADPATPVDDALFIGNWGDRDRADELREFLLKPARKYKGTRRFGIHGVRYPPEVLESLRRNYGVDYRGWLPNYQVPTAFAQTKVALHVVRQQYMKALPGIPTIRVFEALACGTALVSTRWPDTDTLFREGEDYLVVDSRKDMEEALDWLWNDADAREKLGRSGVSRILAQHTCRHRAEQLLGIVARLRRPMVAATLPAPRRELLEPVAVPVAAARR